MLNIKLKDLIIWADANKIDLDEAHIQVDEIHFHKSHFGAMGQVIIRDALEACGCVLEAENSNTLTWLQTTINLDDHQWSITLFT